MNANDFIDALHLLEKEGDASDISALYAEDAVSGNIVTEQTFTGPDGAHEFWTGYRGTFKTINSTFRNVVEGDGAVALEWTSEATLAGGDEVTYDGVTMLDTKDGKIQRSTAYFDPAPLQPSPA